MNQLPDVVFNAVLDGLSELTLIRLPSSPPAKGLPNVALAWEKALLNRATWRDTTADEDVRRLQQGFAKLLATATRWPLPADLLDNLPPRKPPPPLPKPTKTPRSKAECEALFKEIFTHLKTNET